MSPSSRRVCCRLPLVGSRRPLVARLDVLDRLVVDPHVLDRARSSGDGLADEDDAGRLGAVEVAVVAEGAGQERVAVAVDLENGADDAADGLHLVADLVARALGLRGPPAPCAAGDG